MFLYRNIVRLFSSSCITVVLLTCFPPELQAQQQSDDNHKAPVLIGTELNYPPYSYLDEKGKITGFNVDLANAVAQVMNMNIQIYPAPWHEIRDNLLNGSIDTIAGMYFSKARDRRFDFSPPFVIIHHTAFVRKGEGNLKTEDDLRNKTLIVMDGDIMHDYVVEKGFTSNLIIAETIDDALRELSAGRGDSALLARLPGVYHIKKRALSNIEDTGLLLRPSEYCFAVGEGDKELLGKFSEGLAVLEATGRYQEIHEKWLAVAETRIVPWTLLIRYIGYGLIALLIIASAVLFWIISLRKQIGRRTASLQEEVFHRKSTELRLVHLNSVLRAIRNVNQLITHERDAQKLLQKSCDLLTEREGFFRAWIVVMDDQLKALDMFGSPTTGLFASMKSTILSQDYPKCIRGALKTDDVFTIEDPVRECEGCVFSSSYRNQGGMSIRFKYEDTIYGVLTVSVEKQYLQDEDEYELLRELAGDIGFALHDIEVTREREELQESLKRATVIVENSPLVLFRWKAEENWPVDYVSYNVRRFGYSPESFLDGSVTYPSIIYPDDLDRVAEDVRRYSESDTNEFTQRYRIFSADGRVFWIEDKTTIERDIDGNAVAYQGVIFDITEQANNESELKFQSMLLSQIQDMITATDLDGKITYINEAVCHALGRSGEELLGDYIYSYGENPDRGAGQKEILEKTINEGQWRGEVINYSNDGRAIVLDTRTQLVHDAYAKPIALVGISTDITEMKEMEEALRANEARLQAIFDSAGDVIYLKNKDLVYTHVNPAMEQFFGLRSDAIIGNTDAILFPPEQVEEINEIDRHVLEGYSSRREFNRHVLGKDKIVETIKTPVRDSLGNVIGLCGISRDVTDQVRMREKLSFTLEEKEILLRELYHRTKNNMQVIASIISLRRNNIEHEDVRLILKGIETKIYSIALVHQRLYQSQDLSNLNIKDYIQELSRLLLTSFQEPSHSVSIRYELEEITTLIDIAVPLGIVLSELITNAIKHAFPERKEGIIIISLRRTDKGTLILTVEDNGIGLPDGVDITKARTVGLQIIYNVVSIQLNGTIHVSNEQGTKWEIEIGETEYQERV